MLREMPVIQNKKPDMDKYTMKCSPFRSLRFGLIKSERLLRCNPSKALLEAFVRAGKRRFPYCEKAKSMV